MENTTIGSATGITKPDNPAVLNVNEWATNDTDGHFTAFPQVTGSSLSYWLGSVRQDPLLDHRTTRDLPSYADTVVIGSGISGTLTANKLLEAFPGKSVLVLEAREFCSGATGRNAGHCKPDQYRGFTKYEKAFGAQTAIKMMENERHTWEGVVEYVRENNVDCELWVGENIDVAMTKEVADLAKDNFKRYKAAGGKVDHIKVIQDPKEAASISRLKGAHACYIWPSSTLHPWKLTAHIMRDNLAKGVNLQTKTMARKVIASEAQSGHWTVNTDRGNVECSRVVHASNAYSAAVESSLLGLITPGSHMCTKVFPPSSFSGSKALKHSYGVLLPDGATYSINARLGGDGNVLVGGSNPGQAKFNEWLKDHPHRCADDGFAGVQVVGDAVHEFVDKEFDGWAEAAASGPIGLHDHIWSGVVGMSADGVPFVGELPGLPGQWICAGHHGHGMGRIFTAAPGLVKLMKGDSWDEVGLPKPYQISIERIEKLRSLEKKKVVVI